MKKLKGIQLTLVAILFAMGTLFAQDDYHWDSHGIGFSAPSNFAIESNNYNDFSASNNNIFLSLMPWQDASVSDDDLAAATIGAAVEMNYDQLTDADELQIDDFSGYYVEGTKDGYNAFIACLLDTESSTNVVVVIVYADGYAEQAADIMLSMYAYDE